MVEIHDARVAGTFPVYPPKHRKAGRARAYRQQRTREQLDAYGFHHLGPHLSADPKPGQTVLGRAVWRAKRQPYHVWVQPGLVVLAWPFECITWHGNGLNGRALGIVVAGNFPGLEAYRRPHHDDPADYAEAIAATLQYLRGELPHVRLLLTHSQYANKPADPGEGVAKLITAAGRAMLPPLTPVPSLAVGTGAPWPHEWRMLGDT